MLELKDYINWEVLIKQSRCAGGHTDIMDNLFYGAEIAASYVESDYQGKEGYVYKLMDGRFVLVNDYFGSCSGCDAWEDADDDTAKELINAIVNNAKVVGSIDEAIQYLESMENSAEHYDWDGLCGELLKELLKYKIREAK